jgi:hypothetical protein
MMMSSLMQGSAEQNSGLHVMTRALPKDHVSLQREGSLARLPFH